MQASADRTAAAHAYRLGLTIEQRPQRRREMQISFSSARVRIIQAGNVRIVVNAA